MTTDRTSKGLAYVTFADIDSSQRALREMDHASFQGRLLHVMPAITRAGKEEADARGPSADANKSVKKERAAKRKETAGREFNWGMLYMNVSLHAARELEFTLKLLPTERRRTLLGG